MEGLTRRQEQVLEFIRESVRDDGYPPTVREICAALGLSSPSTVHAHLANLERLGLIKRDPTKPRALELVQRPTGPRARCRWSAAWPRARPSSPRRTSRRCVEVPAFLRRDDGDFVLRVQGDSMVDVGIYDGDFIVVHPRRGRRQRRDRRGRWSATRRPTKRFFREGRTVRLQPENRLYEPIIVNADEVRLVGKVVGVLRKL